MFLSSIGKPAQENIKHKLPTTILWKITNKRNDSLRGWHLTHILIFIGTKGLNTKHVIFLSRIGQLIQKFLANTSYQLHQIRDILANNLMALISNILYPIKNWTTCPMTVPAQPCTCNDICGTFNLTNLSKTLRPFRCIKWNLHPFQINLIGIMVIDDLWKSCTLHV